MRRIVLWCLSTLSALVLLFGYSTSTSGPSTAASVGGTTSSYSGSLSSSQASGTSGDGPDPAAGDSSSSSSSSSAGSSQTVTGQTASTQWGPVQVALTIDGTTITDVQVLQYPTGDRRDEEINSYALPILIQETLDAQSASIDMVSGATVTSGGYLQSLQSALDQVGA